MNPSFAGPRYRWPILGMALLVVFGALGLARFSYAAILPSMQAALGLSNAQAGGLATADLSGYLLMSLVGGVLAAHLGPRRVIAAGLLVCVAGLLLTGVAWSYAPALLGRLLAGFGTAMSNIPAQTMVGQWFSHRRRGLVTGTVGSGASLGLIVTGPLVPWMVASFGGSGWRMSWYALAAGTFILAVASFAILRDRPSYEADEGKPLAVPTHTGGRRLYLSSAVWHLGFVYFCFGFAFLIYLTFFTKRLISDLGFSPEAAGTLFMIMGWAGLPCAIMWGWIADVIGRKWAIAAALVLQAVAIALFAVWTSTAGLTVSAVLYGLTIWGIPPIVAVICNDIMGPVIAPAAYGFLTVFHGLGQAAGPYVAGRMADGLGSFTAAYLVAAGVAVLGAVGMVFLRSADTRHSNGHTKVCDTPS